MLKTIIVAEIGSNWEGSVLTAKKIIQECKKAGADAILVHHGYFWKNEDARIVYGVEKATSASLLA